MRMWRLASASGCIAGVCAAALACGETNGAGAADSTNSADASMETAGEGDGPGVEGAAPEGADAAAADSEGAIETGGGIDAGDGSPDPPGTWRSALFPRGWRP